MIVEDEASCIVTDTVTVNSLLNIEDDQTSELTVYPNPTASIITISLEGAFEYCLFNNDGKLLSCNKGFNKVQIDFTEFADGIYFVEITSENRNRSVQLIKQ